MSSWFLLDGVARASLLDGKCASEHLERLQLTCPVGSCSMESPEQVCSTGSVPVRILRSYDQGHHLPCIKPAVACNHRSNNDSTSFPQPFGRYLLKIAAVRVCAASIRSLSANKRKAQTKASLTFAKQKPNKETKRKNAKRNNKETKPG